MDQYQLQILTLMKRTHSALLLQHMANSIQQSLQQQQPMETTQVQHYMARTKSSAQLEVRGITQQQNQNRVFVLEKQIAYLEKELQGSKNTIRSYSRELQEYENTTDQMAKVNDQLNVYSEKIDRVRNQICMLSEQISSRIFNAEERVAEKQYYEELVETYSRQYQGESQLIMKIVALQKENEGLKKQIEKVQIVISKKKGQMEQWKQETSYDLNQHRVKNTLKHIRMQLIADEDQCDIFCQEHELRKVRELMCLFFKNHAKKNGISNEEADKGFDMFICKWGLVEQFGQFIRERLVYNKPKSDCIQNYITGLTKMQEVVRKNSTQFSQKMYDLQLDDIKELLSAKNEKEKTIQKNEQSIKEITKQLDDLFGHESLAVIEYLREKSNKYDIRQIKNTLRENKKQQDNRIAQIKQARKRADQLEFIIQKDQQNNIKHKNEEIMGDLTQQLFVYEQELFTLKEKQLKLCQKKDDLERLINNAISKWRERDENKGKLKDLYSQLNNTKKRSQTTTYRKESIKSVNNIRKSTNSEYPLAESRHTKHSKNGSIISINQSKSILSLSNPYEKIMKKQSSSNYQPILSDCQLILSKKLPSNRQSKQIALSTEFKSFNPSNTKPLSMVKQLSKRDLRQTQYKVTKKNKQNDIWVSRNKTTTQTQAKSTTNYKNSAIKGNMTKSERSSLSQLLISKFNR